jgi:hypothetical protein
MSMMAVTMTMSVAMIFISACGHNSVRDQMQECVTQKTTGGETKGNQGNSGEL